MNDGGGGGCSSINTMSRISTAMTMTESKLKPALWGHRRINIKPMYHLIGTRQTETERVPRHLSCMFYKVEVEVACRAWQELGE